jgi:hypothetical protein
MSAFRSARKRTLEAHTRVSAKCRHERTRAAQQKELLLYDLVRKTHVRKIEPKCLGGLEIDRQFKLRWLHDRQFGRLFALENPSDVDACLTPGVQSAGAVTNQASCEGELAHQRDCRNCVTDCERGKLRALGVEKDVLTDNQPANRQFSRLRKGGIKFAFGAGIQNL